MNDKPFECGSCGAAYSSALAALHCCRDTARPWDHEENWD